MFIELTDHLRCPADHEESYLVLLPSAMNGREVVSGELGCPVCGRVFRVSDGIADLRIAAPVAGEHSAGHSALDADGLHALLGLSGPGGYLVLVGSPGGLWQELLERTPGVAPVVISPPSGLASEYPVSLVEAERIPLKTRSMRGVALGAGFGDNAGWVAEAARVILPGLRVVGEGPPPEVPELDLLASTEGVWVAARNSH